MLKMMDYKNILDGLLYAKYGSYAAACGVHGSLLGMILDGLIEPEQARVQLLGNISEAVNDDEVSTGMKLECVVRSAFLKGSIEALDQPGLFFKLDFDAGQQQLDRAREVFNVIGFSLGEPIEGIYFPLQPNVAVA